MQLVEINPQDVQRVFPSFYHQDSQFFMINHGDEEVGIYGVKAIDEKTCEISLCIFEEYRYKIPYRKTLKLLLSYPFTLKYDTVLISSTKKSIITLLAQCYSLGVRYLGYINKKIWFAVERSLV